MFVGYSCILPSSLLADTHERHACVYRCGLKDAAYVQSAHALNSERQSTRQAMYRSSHDIAHLRGATKLSVYFFDSGRADSALTSEVRPSRAGIQDYAS